MTKDFSHLYIHIPFCSDICDYCDLFSVVEKNNLIRKQYLKKLSQLLVLHSSSLSKLKSIFIGGGTPSSLNNQELIFLLSNITQNLSLKHLEEWTIECNPKTINEEKIKIFKKFSINRLSFGSQSNLSKIRKKLGRRNSNNHLEKAIDLAKKYDFTNFNIDLIYGIPKQNLKDWQQDLDITLELEPKHISTYALTLSEETKIYQRYQQTNEDEAYQMYQLTQKKLQQNAFEHYEISNFAKDNFFCKHNFAIWQGERYLGLGAGAVSFNGKLRTQEVKNIEMWLNGTEALKDDISLEDRSIEILAFGLRTTQGWNKKELLDKVPDKKILEKLSDKIQYLINEKLVINEKEKLIATKKGLLFSNNVIEYLLN